jgi:hypothetical protein
MFWFFRAIVCLEASGKEEFIIVPLNLGLEIALLFATVPCFILIFKRNLIGATFYFGMYGAYFGTALYQSYEAYMGMGEITVDNTFVVPNTVNLIVCAFGVIIPLLTFLDILVNKNRNRFNGDKKTDWYYKNSDYDRQYDERADRNQYKIR